MRLHRSAVLTCPHALHPFRMIEVPLYGLREPLVQTFLRLPTELLADARVIDRIASIVAGPIRTNPHEPRMGALGGGGKPVQNRADRSHDLEVRTGLSADVI